MKTFPFLLLLPLFLTAADFQPALEKLDREFDDSFQWWARVWDPATGGAYYSLSGKQAVAAGREGFGPDIEATSKLIGVCAQAELLEDKPLQAFKNKVVTYFQERQDPESGFFKDPQYKDSYTSKLLSRAMGMSKNSLAKCGAEPLYPLPMERVELNEEAAAHFHHLQNKENFQVWLETLPWQTRIWTSGSSLRAESGIFKSLDPEIKAILLDTLEAFLIPQQQPDGYYGANAPADSWYGKLSGSYKIISFLESNDRPIPMGAQIKATTLKHLERDYDNSIVLYNTVNMLTILNRNGFPLSDEEKAFLLERSTQLIRGFKTPDGGFSTFKDRPCPVEMGRRLGLDVVEGNTNASGLLYKTRNLLHQIVTGNPQEPPHPRSGDLGAALEELQ